MEPDEGGKNTWFSQCFGKRRHRGRKSLPVQMPKPVDGSEIQASTLGRHVPHVREQVYAQDREDSLDKGISFRPLLKEL